MSITTKKITLILTLSLCCLTLLTACGARRGQQGINPARIDGSSWLLTHMDGIRVGKREAQTLDISISRARASGRAACNSYSAECLITPRGEIQITNLTSTRMACSNMMSEHIFFAALTGAKAVRTDGDRLMLYATSDASGVPNLTFKRR